MARKPRSKRSETMDIRVSHEEKRAFMEAVKRRGVSASTMIREAMAHFAQAELDWRERMKRRLIAGGTVLAIAAGSVGAWEIMRRGDFGTAHAEGVTSSFQMRIGVDDAGVERVFRSNTQIVILPGESSVFAFDLRSPQMLAALLADGTVITGGLLSVGVSLDEVPESDDFMYSINVSVIDQDGNVHATPINPRIATRIDAAASVESRFGTDAEIIINLIPLSVEH